MGGYALLIPELLAVVTVAWALFAELLPGGDRGSAYIGASLMGIAGVSAAVAPLGESLFGGLLVFDGPARLVRVAAALLAAVWLLWTAGRGEGRVREAVALAVLATAGAMLMAASRELITLLLAIELATMPAYVLIGYRSNRIDGLEGALKYFLLSMLTSLVMLYGMSLLFGVAHTTRFAEFDLSSAGVLGTISVVLVYVGLFAKLSAAPFHYWAPDAYEGSEAWTVAFVSTVPKVAGAVVLAQMTAALAPTVPRVGPVLIVAAVASMVLGNLAALSQSDVRRMMAYSGVAHTGYLMLGVAALSSAGLGGAVLYSLAYAVPSLGVMLLVAEEGVSVADFNGLVTRRPAAAWGLVVMLLSLIGIPPMLGFFGKLTLFSAAIDAGLVYWVAVAIAMSVVSAAYYLRLVKAAFFAQGEPRAAVAASKPANAAVALCVVGTLALGVFSGPFLQWAGIAIR